MKLIVLSTLFTAIVGRTGNTHHGASIRRRRSNTKRRGYHKNATDIGARIVGGIPAVQGAYPWFVDWDQSCGASLIHDDIVLTAAHCSGISNLYVNVGSWDVNSNEGVQRKQILHSRLHPNFNPDSMVYDYMVMKIDSAVTGISPIPVNGDGNLPIDNEILKVIGHGRTSKYGGSTSDILMEVDVNYIPYNRCNPSYEASGASLDETTMMCAGVSGGGKDSCQGDSGGPLFVEKDGVPIQVGIVSWGFGCADANFPGVYSRISGVKDWIDQQICELSDNPPNSCTTGDGGGQDVSYPQSTPTNPDAPMSSPIPATPIVTPSQHAPSPVSPVTHHAAPIEAEDPPVNSPSSSTTVSPPFYPRQCVDANIEFIIDAVIGSQDCTWLNTNLSRYQYLCSFFDVAINCAKTCNVCDQLGWKD